MSLHHQEATAPCAPSPEAGVFALCRWALGYGLRRKPVLLAALGAMLLKTGVDALKPWPMLFLVDYVLQTKVMPGWAMRVVALLPGSHAPASLIGWSVTATVLLFLVSWGLGVAYTWFGISLGQRMIYDLAADLFSRLQQLSLRFHARQSVGDNIRRVTTDCACVSVILKDALLPVISAAASLGIMFAILWRVDATLTLLALAVVPWMALVFRLYAQPMLDLSSKQQEAEARLYQFAEQTFSAMPVIQAFGAEGRNDRRYAAATRDTITATLALTRVQLRFKLWMGLVMAAGTSVILWVGVLYAMTGHLSIGTILLFLSYLASFYEPLAAVNYTTMIVQGAAGSAKRVLEILTAQVEVTDRPGAKPLKRARGQVRLENVTFGYEPERAVLRGLNLEVSAGECIALVGASGAGKSTLAALIPRFFDPWEGRVLLDGCDLREVTLKSLRSQVAIVLQEPFLFPISIAANIAYGCPQAAMSDIQTAARAAGAHEFIAALPRGYQTVVGERGATLSAGQRQRMALARALLKDAPILILDEPTSALDAETEHSLMETLDGLTQNRTTFIISHRMSTIRRASRIVVLDEGRIVEMGRHDQLLAAQGHYARLLLSST
ncbi:MAG: ABC transporter ATP-binding protein [Verrucomicrobia bacterium]|nr:ABC transporter ATP-binding protein [Verrucomicrobiota bacterium]